MTSYALGTARLSVEGPLSPAPAPGLHVEAEYPMGLEEQPLPETPYSWNEAFGGGTPVPVPMAIYACTEPEPAEGEMATLRNTLAEGASAQALEAVGLPLMRRRAVGLRTSDYAGLLKAHPIRGVELDAASQVFRTNGEDNYWMDAGAVGCGLLVVYRINRVPTEARLAMVGKGDPEQSQGMGYALDLSDAGRLVFTARTEGGQVIEVQSHPDRRVDDGAWHCALASIEHVIPNGSAETILRLHTENGLDQEQSLPEALDFASLASTFHLGTRGALETCRVQVAYLAFWSAADTPNLATLYDGTAIEKLWSSFRAPKNESGTSDDPLVLSQYGTVGWPGGVSEEGTGSGEIAVKAAFGQLPYSGMGDARAARGGFSANPQVRNLLAWSERITDQDPEPVWETEALPPGGVPTATAYAEDSPDGTRSASRVTFDGNGLVSQEVVVESAVVTGSVWVKLLSRQDPNGVLKLGNGADDVAEVPFSELERSGWRRLQHGYTIVVDPPVPIRLGIRVEASGTTELAVWGAQIEVSDFMGPYVPTWDQPVTVFSSSLGAEWNGGGAPTYQITATGWCTFRVRFPYGKDQANGRTLCRMRLLEDVPGGAELDVHVTREAYEGEGGRILLQGFVGANLWGRAYSTGSTGLEPGQPASEAREVQVSFSWDFENATLWLQVDGEAGVLDFTSSDTYSDIVPQSLSIGHDGLRGGQLGAPIYGFRLSSEQVSP